MKDIEYFTGHELRVEVSRFILSSYEGDANGCTIFCSILNQSKKRARVKLISSFIINSDSEQRERDYYLTGYQFTEKNIEAEAKCTFGDIFLENNAGKIRVGWRYGVEIQDMTNGKTYDVLFKLDNIQTKEWKIISCDITSSLMAVTPKMLSKNLTKSVERIEAFEEKLGIKIENVIVNVSDNFEFIKVLFDMYALNGKSLNSSLYLTTSYYGEDNNLLGISDLIYVDEHSFMGFETCEIVGEVDNANEVKKIRLYPKKDY